MKALLLTTILGLTSLTNQSHAMGAQEMPLEVLLQMAKSPPLTRYMTQQEAARVSMVIGLQIQELQNLKNVAAATIREANVREHLMLEPDESYAVTKARQETLARLEDGLQKARIFRNEFVKNKALAEQARLNPTRRERNFSSFRKELRRANGNTGP